MYSTQLNYNQHKEHFAFNSWNGYQFDYQHAKSSMLYEWLSTTIVNMQTEWDHLGFRTSNYTSDFTFMGSSWVCCSQE